ncbi:hypothetical protein V8F33_004565 [Rhypophila sp. PSN 637]
MPTKGTDSTVIVRKRHHIKKCEVWVKHGSDTADGQAECGHSSVEDEDDLLPPPPQAKRPRLNNLGSTSEEQEDDGSDDDFIGLFNDESDYDSGATLRILQKEQETKIGCWALLQYSPPSVLPPDSNSLFADWHWNKPKPVHFNPATRTPLDRPSFMPPVTTETLPVDLNNIHSQFVRSAWDLGEALQGLQAAIAAGILDGPQRAKMREVFDIHKQYWDRFDAVLSEDMTTDVDAPLEHGNQVADDPGHHEAGNPVSTSWSARKRRHSSMTEEDSSIHDKKRLKMSPLPEDFGNFLADTGERSDENDQDDLSVYSESEFKLPPAIDEETEEGTEEETEEEQQVQQEPEYDGDDDDDDDDDGEDADHDKDHRFPSSISRTISPSPAAAQTTQGYNWLATVLNGPIEVAQHDALRHL